MKKHICTISLVCAGIFASAQNSIPNGNFETWNSFTYNDPVGFPATSNSEAYFKCNISTPNVLRSTDAYHGTYAAQLTTVKNSTDTCMAYMVNTNPNGNFPNWPGGIAYNQQATGFRGYYKCAVVSPDTAKLGVIFKLNGSPIGTYIYSFYGNQSAYTLFNFPLTPPLPSAPDTVIFAAASSHFMANNLHRAGSMLQFDSLSFTGVASQPALFNGDFENWQSFSIYSPVNWTLQSDRGFARTTDAYAGTYAMQLTTYAGDNNGVPRASAGILQNGYCSGGSPCVYVGGYPFTNQIDTLEFAYKYIPKAGDSAYVGMNFKKNGISIWGTGKKLGASATYTVVRHPFNLAQMPDSVIIEVRSSLYNDTALSFVGSDLKIDEMHFKSQPLNTDVPTLSVENSVSVYPNPTAGEFNVQTSLFNIQDVEVYNAVGEKVISRSVNAKRGTLSLNDQGIYLVRVNSNGKTFTKKIIVNK